MFEKYTPEIWYTVVLIGSILVFRIIFGQIVNRFSKNRGKLDTRKNLVKRYADFLLFIVAFVIGVGIWGFKAQDIGLFFSSAFAVVGVAFFAIWSILSNITAGVIIFFAFPFKIGDRIRIHNKDLPVTATIINIHTFYILLRTNDDELLTYPNNLVLQNAVSVLGSKEESVFETHQEPLEGETDPTI